MPVITNQNENPKWLNEDKGFDIKKILYIALAIIKGAGSGLLFSAWLLVGITLAANYVPAVVSLKDFVWGTWWIFWIVVTIFDSIVNFKNIK